MKVLHELRDLHWNGLTAEEKKTYAYRITDSGCSSDIPPLHAPYDIAIDWNWYEDNHEVYKVEMSDWYKYGNPIEWEGVEDDETAA